MSAFHDLEMTSITGESVNFDQFRGDVCLLVNVASAWGLTPQYAGLRTLHNDTDGFQVLGFPCNQFGAQEPGSDAEVLTFVTENYDVNFPMFSKIEVNGDGAAPLYNLLKGAQSGAGETSDITWNFEKFLVDGEGNVVQRFAPTVTPEEVAAELPKYL